MAAKEITHGEEARRALLSGVNKLANAVRVTWARRAETSY